MIMIKCINDFIDAATVLIKKKFQMQSINVMLPRGSSSCDMEGTDLDKEWNSRKYPSNTFQKLGNMVKV